MSTLHQTLSLIVFGVLAICASSCADSRPVTKGFQLVGYLPDYRIAAANPTLLGKYYSDIILFSVEPTPSGGIDSRRLNAGRLRLVKQLKAAGVGHVLVTAGGAGRSQAFAAAAHSGTSRQHLVQSLLLYCQKHGLDGVDFDWELPESAQQRADYDDLIVETKQAFRPKNLLVTVAVTARQGLGREALQALDRVHLMAYDGPGAHSTYEFATGSTEAWLAQGLPARKLCLGVPFYGRGVVHRRHAAAYSTIAGASHVAPGTDQVHDLYFNGAATLQRKAAYARSKGLAGMMVWEVGQDVSDGTLARSLSP